MGIKHVSSCPLKTRDHSVVKTFSKMSNYCAQIRRQTQQAFFVYVAILILLLKSEDAILQPTIATQAITRFPLDRPSQRRDAKHSAGSAESRRLI